MRILWAVLGMLLLGAVWAVRDPMAGAPEACDAPPWELLEQARRDDGAPAARPASSAASASAPAATAIPAEPPGASAERSVQRSTDVSAAMPPGAGTERQPFRVSWELLGQADGHVRGDGTLEAMPRAIELLNGTWIELSGYYAPAVIAPSTDELVFMLNRWDGCCIGLPPTPYDSALVKTRAPVDFALQHQFRFGTLRGRLVMEPFALGGLVLGLYRIEDAELMR